MYKKISIFALMLCLTLVPNFAYAYACSCEGNSSAKIHIETTDVVFRGHVIGTNANMNKAKHSFPENHVTSFSVREVWKGPRKNTIDIAHSTYPSSCGVEFSTDQELLVFARDNGNGTFGTDFCTMPFYSIVDVYVMLKERNISLDEYYMETLAELPSYKPKKNSKTVP